MKGGGFIVFLFLLVCFLWGVTSIVGGIRRRIQAWTTPEPSPPQPAPPRTSPKTAGATAAQMHPPLVIDVAPAPVAASTQSKHAQDTVAETLASLREASQLHRNGVLTDAEFAGIKAQLLAGKKT